MEGFERPRVISIPEKLFDPYSETEVSTTKDGVIPAGTLVLRTSDKGMRYGQRKFRHHIDYIAISGYIGFVEISELGVQSTFADRLYGECELLSLENYKQNDRQHLSKSPLTRAVEAWIRSKVEEYAREFEARDRRRIDQEEKDSLTRMNEALDKWKNQFLDQFIKRVWSQEDAGAGKGGTHLKTGLPTRIEIVLTHSKAGKGVPLRPSIKFFDSSGKRVRPVPFRWVSEDNNVAMVDEDLMIVNTFSFGKTRLYAENLNGKLRSNTVDLEVVHIHEIKIVPENIELQAGSIQSLTANCKLSTGETRSGVYLVWTESNSSVARVSSAGVVFGFEPGETEVTAGDDHCLSAKPAKIKVLATSDTGKGYPKVLVSEYNWDPDTGDTVKLSPQDPPVHQRVQDVDRNIWWINSASPLARTYLDKTLGYGYESREWRIYFLERYMEVMVKIVLYFDYHQSEELSFENWMRRWDETTSQMQEFARTSLKNFLDLGILPGEEA